MDKIYSLIRAKRFDEARGLLEKNSDKNSRLLLGTLLYKTGKYDEAIVIFEKLIEDKLFLHQSYNNLALCLGSMGFHRKAEDYLYKAIVHCNTKERGAYWFNLSNEYDTMSCYERAEKAMNKALKYDPTSSIYWCSYAGIQLEKGDIKKAIDCYEKAIQYNYNNVLAHAKLGEVWHLIGEHKKGYEEYEWRLTAGFDQCPECINVYDPNKKWLGQSLKNQRLLVYCEQGIGDCFQYIRYLPLLEKMGAHIILQGDIGLKLLLKDQLGIKEFVAYEDYSVKFNYFCPILSIPLRLNFPTVPSSPYIKYDRKIDLSQFGRGIGIVWLGSPLHPRDKLRSCYLKKFKVLKETLFSLQVDKRLRKHRNSPSIIDYQEDCEDMVTVDLSSIIHSWSDTASILNSIDCLVSVDTSIVHLAGAMGIKTYVLLPFACDWRWGTDQKVSEWYPSVQIIRQKKPGDWDSCFRDLVKQLPSHQSVG